MWVGGMVALIGVQRCLHQMNERSYKEKNAPIEKCAWTWLVVWGLA